MRLAPLNGLSLTASCVSSLVGSNFRQTILQEFLWRNFENCSEKRLRGACSVAATTGTGLGQHSHSLSTHYTVKTQEWKVHPNAKPTT